MLKNALIIICLVISSPCFASGINDYTNKSPTPTNNIQFIDDKQTIHNLNDYLGKVVLLNFWATWCIPCVDEMPAISKLKDNVADNKDIIIIPLAIDFEGSNAIKDFYKNYEISNLPIFVDNKNQSFKAFSLRALPTTIIINKKGQEVARILGQIEWDSKEVKDYLVKVAKE
jgi:thiol-disulfide isomerase/thioredoxin